MYTGQDGAVQLALNPHEKRTLFVIPREGSFAIVQIAAESPSDHVKVIVPRPEASIGIRATRKDGTAIPNVGLMLRYNGHMIPGEAVQALALQQSTVVFIDADGVATLAGLPLGHYEIWPVLTRKQQRELLAGTPGPAAAQLMAQPGQNWVTLTIETP